MKKLLSIYMPIVVLGAVALFSADVKAATLNLGGSYNSGASVNVNTDADIHSGAGSLSASSSGSSNTGTQAGNSGNASVNSINTSSATLNVGGETGAFVNVKRSDVDAASGENVNVAAANIATQADLDSFARASIQNDSNIDGLSLADDHIDVSYNEPGRFLGIFPVTIPVSVHVAQDGTISASYPWYKFIIATDGSSDIQTQVNDELGASIISRTGASFTNREKAEIAAKIADVLKARIDARASASGSASSSSY